MGLITRFYGIIKLIRKKIIIINIFDFYYFSLFLVYACIQAYKKILKECSYGLKIRGSTNLIKWNIRKNDWKFHIRTPPPFFMKYDS